MEVRPTNRETQYFVSSETNGGEYQVVQIYGQWKCTCKDFLHNWKGNKSYQCKHIDRLFEYLKETEGGNDEEEKQGGMLVPPHPTNGMSNSNTRPMSKWVKVIHGEEFIQYEGLLAMAHEKGLQDLGCAFISVTETLALAYAWAVFKDGRIFWDAADATPENVNKAVKAHFPRVALTRAKARVLRDALNIGMVAVEELEE